MKTDMRKKLLAIIHMQKKRLSLSDDDYRTILHSVTGYYSAKDFKTQEQFRAIIAVLNRQLGLLNLPPVHPGGARKYQSPFLYAVSSKAKAVLGNSADARLAGYLKKMGKASLEECSPKELRRIMGFLSNISKTTGQEATTCS